VAKIHHFCRGLIYQAQTERWWWLAWCCGLWRMGSHEAKLKGGGDGRSRAGGRGGEVMKHHFLNRKVVVAGAVLRSVEDGGVMKQKSKGGGGWRDRAGGWVRQGHEAKPCQYFYEQPEVPPQFSQR